MRLPKMYDELRNFIFDKINERYKTKNYMEIGKSFVPFLRKLIYNNKPLFDYINEDLAKDNALEFLYLLLNDSDPVLCKVCKRKTRFRNIREGYSRYCSNQCSNKDNEVKDKKKQTFLIRYGVNTPMQSEIVKEKYKQTCLDRYGVENPNQFDEFKNKKKQTYLQKYDVENPFQNKDIQERYKMTILKKYGVENPSQINEIKEKKKQTCMKNYQVSNPSQSDSIKEKRQNTWKLKYGDTHPLKNENIKEASKQTCLNKYGTEYVFQNEEIKKKIKQTNMERYNVENISQSDLIKNKKIQTSLEHYGVTNPIQNKDIQEKYKQTCLNKYGAEYPLQNVEIIKKLQMKQRKAFYIKLFNSNRLRNLVKPNFNLEDYINVNHKYSFTCLKCNNVFESHLDDGIIPRCLHCFPRIIKSSKCETEIYDFLKEHLDSSDVIEKSNKTVLNGLELDIYIPNKYIAIEFNGLYWHSEISGNKKWKYHLNKTIQCKKNGIQLIHIFEDEWIEKKEIVKSILLNKIGKISNKIFARKCEIREINNESASNFLNSNHLQGFINGIHLGLYYNDELLCCLTMGKPRYNKNYEWEILRFCSKNYYNIIGGLSKLFNYFKKKNNPRTVITYVDLRYGEGKAYHKINFVYIGRTVPGYYYLNENLQRISRLQFQKHLLENKLQQFDPELTEWENMQLNNYDRIWDCGNNIYVWKNGN